YYDGAEVFRAATPDDMHKPMYMIANLAVGGWAGTPAAAAFPAEMQIDYIRAYAHLDSEVSAPGFSLRLPANVDGLFSQMDGRGARTVWDWTTRMTPSEEKARLGGEWSRILTGNDKNNYLEGSNAQYNELNGGRGNDVLKGNGGIDVFVFEAGHGNDRVLDFSQVTGNSDKIQLKGFAFDSFAELEPYMHQHGSDTLIQLGADQFLLLDDTDVDLLVPSSFVFME
ncbi:MAG: hypothetical protein JWR39_689, partial [Devosia sp.]|nr:hypothetical protein [Devosia sp.]